MNCCTVKTVPGEVVIASSTERPRYQVLIDSDAFVGWLYAKDSHHAEASRIFTRLEDQRWVPVVTSLVVAEAATVLSHREGQPLARTFLDLAKRYPVIHITRQLQQHALDLFQAQKARGTSVTDCANVVVMRQYQIPTIFSFDKVYPKAFGLKPAA